MFPLGKRRQLVSSPIIGSHSSDYGGSDSGSGSSSSSFSSTSSQDGHQVTVLPPYEHAHHGLRQKSSIPGAH